MIPAEKQKMLSDVLAWVNGQRSYFGLEPLRALRRGKKLTACECPIARSLVDAPRVANVVVFEDRYEYWLGEDEASRDVLPRFVADFVRSFDLGHIPELDAVAA